MNRPKIPKNISAEILRACHHRCCICPEHRRVASIHHIDGNPENNSRDNLAPVCAECHADVHANHQMRRNIYPEDVKTYKLEWEKNCLEMERNLSFQGSFVNSYYYISQHRLAALYSQVFGQSLYSKMPFSLPTDGYVTLWPNSENPLPFDQLNEYKDKLANLATKTLLKCKSKNLALIETGACDVQSGELVHFSANFSGRDVPSQTMLTRSRGNTDLPAPTMRREIVDYVEMVRFETCMMLDMKYMFSDSSFITFSEKMVWNGYGIALSFNEGVGSCDKEFERRQLIVSPVCIGTPLQVLRSAEVDADDGNIDDYRSFLIDA